MREAIIQKVLDKKIVAIVRGVYGEDCLNLAKALYAGGIEMMEVTFDQSKPESLDRTSNTVKLLVENLGDKMIFGAGTVTSLEMLELAKNAGAQFIVSPDTCEEVIRATVAADMVSIPGALTPSEMANAHRYGADFIKVFPANLVGPAYFKTVAAPLSQIRMLAVGGVDASNIKDYVAAGAVGTGVAGCLFKKEWVKAGEWDKITEASKKFVSLL